MFFQKVIKGIAGGDQGLSDGRARNMLLSDGIICRWWENQSSITPAEIQAKLTERNLDWHLNKYDWEDPPGSQQQFCEHTPFISTTAGTVERAALRRRNYLHDPFLTALWFATRGLQVPGYIFYGYVYTLGKRAVELQPFAEEVRELHLYVEYLPFQPEGEITAKIIIPAINLQRFERYDPITVRDQDKRGAPIVPAAGDVVVNPNYADPYRFANIREVLA